MESLLKAFEYKIKLSVLTGVFFKHFFGNVGFLHGISETVCHVVWAK